MQRVSPGRKKFKLPAPFDANDYVKGSFGV
jgi:hypothetical protein